MRRKVSIPNGSWPMEMRAGTAAAYCDEPSVEAFLAKVVKGLYTQPTVIPGSQPKWHRAKLDSDIARRHGMLLPTIAEDLTGLI